MGVRQWINLQSMGFLVILIMVVIVATYFLPIIMPGSVAPNGMPFEDQPGFLWTFRGIDVITQGVILVTATVAISAIFRQKTKPGNIEKVVEAEPEEIKDEEDLT
jgi:uncharacterized membrane protein